MKRFIVTSALAVIATACGAETYQLRQTTPNVDRVVNVNQGHVTVSEDSTKAYRECMRRVEAKALGGLDADMYCRCHTTAPEERSAECNYLIRRYSPGMLGYGGSGPGAYMQYGYGPSAFGPAGVPVVPGSYPTYVPVSGGWEYSGTSMDPAVTYSRLAAQGYPVAQENYVTHREHRSDMGRVSRTLDSHSRVIESNRRTRVVQPAPKPAPRTRPSEPEEVNIEVVE